jgi:hypothetical protein
MGGETQTNNINATTTAEQDRASRGIRRKNSVWENRQAAIAIAVVAATMIAAIDSTLIHSADADIERAFQFLTNICFVVVGFYFGTQNARSGARPRPPG